MKYLKKYWQWIMLLIVSISIQLIYPDSKMIPTISMIIVGFILWYRLTIEAIKLFTNNKVIKRIFPEEKDVVRTEFLSEIAKSVAIIVGAIVLGVYTVSI